MRKTRASAGRRIWFALSLMFAGSMALAGGNNPPNQPTPLNPSNGATEVSQTPILDASAFSDPNIGDTHQASQWQIALDEQFSNLALNDTETSFDTADLTSYAVPSGTLAQGTTYRWRTRYQDNNGAFSSFSTTFTFTTAGSAAPNQPTLLSPLNGSANIVLAPTLLASAFSDPDANDTHSASQWQVALDAQFSNIVVDDTQTTSNASDLTSYDVPTGILSPGITYFWRTRYQDNEGLFSSFANPFSFTTLAGNNAPNQPTLLSPSNGATDVSLTPTLSASAFSDPDAGDAHAASRWQIALDAQFSSIVLNEFETSFLNSNLTSFDVPAGTLAEATTYFWRTRYSDSNGAASAFADPFSFTTLGGNNAPNQPTLLDPPNGATNISLTPTLDASAFSDPDAGDTHAASQWQIALDAQFSNIVSVDTDWTYAKLRVSSMKSAFGTVRH